MTSGARGPGRYERAVRPGLGRDPNPLRRRSDRLQAWSGLAAVLLVIAVLPVALFSSLRTWQHASAISEQEQATRHLVSATVVGSDPEARIARNHLATLSWTYPDQVEHTGHIAVTQSTRPGDLLPVWVDDEGRMSRAPMTRLNVWLDTLGIGFAITGGALLLGLAWYRGSRIWLDRMRQRDLDAEWRRFNGFTESRSEGFPP